MHFILAFTILVSSPLFAQEDCSPAMLQQTLNEFSVRIEPNFIENEDSFLSAKKDFEDFWKKCQKKMSERAWNCFDNLQGFFETYKGIGSTTHTLGFKLPDHLYAQAVSEQRPEYLKLPQLFFKNNRLPKDWRERLDSCQRYYKNLECKEILKWKFLEFEDYCWKKGKTNQKQVVFLIEHEYFDQWILFRWDSPGYPRNQHRPVQVIAVEKKEDRPANKPNAVYFAQYGTYGLDHKFNESCVQCHTNGPLTLNPMPGSIKGGDEMDRLNELNKVIAGYGRLRTPFWEEKYRGPHLGKTVGCTQCHTNEPSKSQVRAPLQFMSTVVTDALLLRNNHPDVVSAKSQGWREAFEEAYSLSSSELEQFKEIYGGEVCRKTYDPISEKGLLAGLHFLRKADEIDEDEYSKAKASALESKKFGNKILKDFELEASESYRLWLRGGQENCISSEASSKK